MSNDAISGIQALEDGFDTDHNGAPRALSVRMEAEPGSSILTVHDLFRKPVSTLRSHPKRKPGPCGPGLVRRRGGADDTFQRGTAARIAIAYLGGWRQPEPCSRMRLCDSVRARTM